MSGHLGRWTTLTGELVRAAATDAGNRSMRAGGRLVWNEEDYDAAVAEYGRLMALRTEQGSVT